MGLHQPRTLEVTSLGPAPVDADSWPLNAKVHHRMQGNEQTDGDFDFTWYDGTKLPPESLSELVGTIENIPTSGSLVASTTGALVIPHGGGTPVLYRDGVASPGEIEMLESQHHHRNFADAIRGEISEKPLTRFDYAGPMTEAVLLGTVAMRLPGETLAGDEAGGRFTNSKAANALLHRAYREGHEVTGL